MARPINRLSAVKIAKTITAGMYADGGGLYLQVTATGAKTWIFRYGLRGKTTDLGLGSFQLLTLAEAREKSTEYRRLLADKQDPRTVRDRARHRAVAAASSVITFADCAARYIDAHKSAWKNPKHIQQWRNSLTNLAGPVIGALPVEDVDTARVLAVLEPIWLKTPETASRLRGRIESILDWATAREYRPFTANPARLKGHLDHLLPSISKSRRVKHHAALPYAALPEFMLKLQQHEGASRLALEMTILTACRTGEVIAAQFAEVDRQAGVWTVPAARMKAGVAHRVPVTLRILAIIDELQVVAEGNPNIFRYRGRTKHLSNMAMLNLLPHIGYPEITVHGFRSTFKDWAREKTDFPRDVVEAALAHTLDNKVEAAYARGDLLDKRRQLMQAWSEYCFSFQPAAAG